MASTCQKLSQTWECVFNLDFLSFLNSLSRAAIFSDISPFNHLVTLFSLITFAGATSFIISTIFEDKLE